MAETMRHEDHRLASSHAAERFKELEFAGGVHRGCGFVDDDELDLV